MDGLVNWEGSQTSDGDRFSSIYTNENGNKSLKSFENYLKRKEKRAADKLLKKQKPQVARHKLMEVSEVLKKDLAV